MIKVNHIETYGWEAAIRGMRNPMNSWEKSDTDFALFVEPEIGPNDLALMKKLFKGGTEHRKYLRQIFVSMDITAPLYWWKEFDTYKVGVTANSCSTMHKIADKEFTIEDFSYEHLCSNGVIDDNRKNNDWDAYGCLLHTIDVLNYFREAYLMHKTKTYWWQMIQLLPSSYNQKRTITMNYENVMTIIRQRTGHKLDEWNDFVAVLKRLPYVGCIMELPPEETS